VRIDLAACRRGWNGLIRNPILASFVAKLLPYRGLGSGLLRALRAYPAMS
jgi:ATP-dependent DNA helicase RecG